MRFVKWLFFLILVGIGLSWLYFKYWDYSKIDPLHLIPSDAVYIFETDEPIAQWKSFSKGPFWSFLKNHKSLKEITDDANYLDSLIASNKNLLKFFGDRHFIMSAHMIKGNDYDFLFAFDLQNASKLNISSTLLGSLSSTEFQVSSTSYRESDIVELRDIQSGDVLYLTQIENYMVCTYTQQIIHQCVDHYAKGELAQNEKFTEVYEKVNRKGIGQFYFNYKYIDEFVGVYFKDPSSFLSQLSTEFSFTALDIYLSETDLKLQGLSSLPNSELSYMQLIQQYGNGKISYHHFMSARTAYVQSIHIDNTRSFYKELIALRETQSGDVAEFSKLKLKIEKTLKLSLEDDFLSWIGDEIVVAQNVPNQLNISQEDVVVALKVNDLDHAHDRLAHIQKQIKKRTPAKFKQLSYKGHSIHYLDLKGMFNLFLGKTFNKITKPYYTIIDQFVVFSNSPKTLIALLEDYENGYVLAQSPAFQQVLDEMPSEMCLFTYASGPLLYPVIKPIVNQNQQVEFKQNKAYFEFFRTASIGFKSKSKGFENLIYVKFSEADLDDIQYQSIAVDSLYQDYVIQSGSMDQLSESELFALEELDKRKYTMYFPDGKSVKIKAKVKNGLLHGDYEEFYLNGNTKVKGNYRKGRKTGIWKYYNKEGKIEERTWESI